MIIYFANRQMQILGNASTHLPRGFVIREDLKTEEVETGVATFSCYIGFDDENRLELEEMTEGGNYILRSDGDENEFYTIIDVEIDTKNREIYIYAEDAGLDLLNEIVGEYEATEAHTAEWYINKFAYDSGFEIGLNEIPDSTTRKLSWDGESTATERIASVATQFGGFEISFSFDIVGMEITHKYINIYEKRGKDVNEYLLLNRDIDRIITKKSVANLATALKCKGGIPENSEKPITLKGYSYDDGDFYVEGDMLKSRNALAKWSRYQWEKLKTDAKGHIVKQYSYETTSQKTLCSHAVTELKKICDTEINYEVDINKLPANIKIGDRINIVDDAGELYLSTRILLLETSICDQKQKATLGEHLIKPSGISAKVQELASQFAEVAAAREKELERILEFEESISNAQEAANEAKTLASDAVASAGDAKTQAAAAELAAKAAEEATKTAVSKAETAFAKAEGIESIANEAKTQAAAASTVAQAAKLDAEKANEDIEALGENLESVSNTMQTDYARKTDLTEATASLQTQISQNAGQIQSTASKVAEIDETVNDAAEKAEQAQNTAASATAKADAAQAEATAAQNAANEAASKAQSAQTAATNAKNAADAAQAEANAAAAKVTAAETELAEAKSNLAAVQSKVDATEEEIAAAQAAVEAAQAAANQAKTDAQTAQNTANTAKTNAATAQSAANKAQLAADAAQNKADEAKQAADKAQADVNALAVRVTTAETKITQNAEKITLAATKTEVTETLGGYYKKAETDSLIEQTASGIRSSVSSEITEKVNAVEIGARNLITFNAIEYHGTTLLEGDTTEYMKLSSAGQYDGISIPYTLLELNEDYVLSYDLTLLSGPGTVGSHKGIAETAYYYVDGVNCGTYTNTTALEKDKKVHVVVYIKTAASVPENSPNIYIQPQRGAGELITMEFLVEHLKIEKGNKPTDWTPAPEDVNDGIVSAQNTASDAVEKVSAAETLIQQLCDNISMLVTDENGQSLMQQNADGVTYSFSTKAIQEIVDKTSADLATLTEELGGTDAAVSELEKALAAVEEKTDYVNIGTYTYKDEAGTEKTEPCVLLGESDSEFKVIITNTQILFRKGSAEPTRITTQGLETENITVENELRQTHENISGYYVWAVRANGHYGLQWKAGDE